MKISEYPSITSITSDNILLVDGTNGTKKMAVTDAVLAALHLISPENHKRIFRGKNLGGAYTAAQQQAVQNGTFEDLWLGDYWTINDINWRIVDFDYWYMTGDSAVSNHHLVIMPDTNLYSAPMNDTLTTANGYVGSKMYTTNLSTARTTISNIFGSRLMQHREYFTNAVNSGVPTAGSWVNSTVDLPNEIMIYGSYIETPSGSNVKRYTIDKTQLALFALHPKFITNRFEYWLRDVVSANMFANVGYYGSATSANATKSSGVRPVFAIM